MRASGQAGKTEQVNTERDSYTSLLILPSILTMYHIIATTILVANPAERYECIGTKRTMEIYTYIHYTCILVCMYTRFGEGLSPGRMREIERAIQRDASLIQEKVKMPNVSIDQYMIWYIKRAMEWKKFSIRLYWIYEQQKIFSIILAIVNSGLRCSKWWSAAPKFWQSIYKNKIR